VLCRVDLFQDSAILVALQGVEHNVNDRSHLFLGFTVETLHYTFHGGVREASPVRGDLCEAPVNLLLQACTLESNVSAERLIELFPNAGLYPVAQCRVPFAVLQNAPSGSGEIVLESVRFNFSVYPAQQSLGKILVVPADQR
jgi:hypothetical protein